MIKSTVIYIVTGVLISTASYAFFADWAKMPMNMMQMSQPQPQASPLVCDCRCN
jgi:hypothetical protein